MSMRRWIALCIFIVALIMAAFWVQQKPVVANCRGKTSIDEGCALVLDASGCVDSKCRHLVITFSGAEMGCLDREGYAKSRKNFALHGYASVCVNYFDTLKGSMTAPFIDQADRLDEALKAAVESPWARRHWTGEFLLLEGISQGATAPMVLLARTDYAKKPHWHGSLKTGACFFDGSYDQQASAQMLGTGMSGGPCLVPLTDAWVLQRYCGPHFAREGCDLRSQPKVSVDTIVDAPVQYAIHDFKLIECGSALDTCIGDLLPGEPIRALCERINKTPGYSCEFASLPHEGHLFCHGSKSDLCREWFDRLTDKTD